MKFIEKLQPCSWEIALGTISPVFFWKISLIFGEKLFSRTSRQLLLILFLPFLSAALHMRAMLGHGPLWTGVLWYTMLQRYQNCLALHKTDLKRKTTAVGLWRGTIRYGIYSRITTAYNLKDLQMHLACSKLTVKTI